MHPTRRADVGIMHPACGAVAVAGDEGLQLRLETRRAGRRERLAGSRYISFPMRSRDMTRGMEHQKRHRREQNQETTVDSHPHLHLRDGTTVARTTPASP